MGKEQLYFCADCGDIFSGKHEKCLPSNTEADCWLFWDWFNEKERQEIREEYDWEWLNETTPKEDKVPT